MRTLNRITIYPEVMEGTRCIRSKRVTMNIIAGLVTAKRSRVQIIKLFPFL